MATEIVMPQMGAEMEEGTVVRWLKQPGEYINRGESIAEIETDKATVDLESFEEGYFLGPAVEDGTTVPVGTLIGYLGARGEQPPSQPGATAAPAGVGAAAPAQAGTAQPLGEGSAGAADSEQPASATPAQVGEQAARPEGQPVAAATGAEVPAPPPPAPSPAAPHGDGAAPMAANGSRERAAPAVAAGERQRVSPVARSIAEEMGIDLRRVRGSGPDGRIMRRDVEEFAQRRAETPAATATPPAPQAAPAQPQPAAAAPAALPAAPARAEPAPPSPAAGRAGPGDGVEPLSKMRQAIARRMAAAKREIPHYYVAMSVDMTEATALRRQVNASLGEDETRISVNDLILKACALALEKHPQFNVSFTEEGLRRNESINIGIAVALPDGLIVPAVLDCQGKSLGAIARASHDVAERARGGRLRQAELADGTFTVSNLGMYGVETLIAIIQPGQAAILGVGKAEPRPVVRDGEVVVREMMTIALSADHRVSDGAQGARFTAAIKELLEHPMRLVL